MHRVGDTRLIPAVLLDLTESQARGIETREGFRLGNPYRPYLPQDRVQRPGPTLGHPAPSNLLHPRQPRTAIPPIRDHHHPARTIPAIDRGYHPDIQRPAIHANRRSHIRHTAKHRTKKVSNPLVVMDGAHSRHYSSYQISIFPQYLQKAILSDNGHHEYLHSVIAILHYGL